MESIAPKSVDVPSALVLQSTLSQATHIYGMLSSHDFAVQLSPAATAPEIEQAVASGTYDLIIVGDKLTELTDTETVSWLSERFDAEIVFVIERLPDHYERILEAGATDCIPYSALWRLLPIALRIAHPDRNVSRYTRRLERLLDVIQELSVLRSRPAFQNRLLTAACELTSASGAGLFLVEGGQMVSAALFPLEDTDSYRFPLAGSLAERAFQSQHPLLIGDMDADDRVPEHLKRHPSFSGKSLAIIPIHVPTPWGVLGCKWEDVNQAKPERVAILQALASVASTVLENLQSYEDLEQRVAERTAALQTSNKELEAFAYSVSHDLRAPLRSVTGFGLILRDELSDALGERGLGYINRILHASDHMGELIEDLLHLSRVLKAEVNPVDIDVTASARAIAQDLDNLSPDRRVEWLIEDDLQVRADKRLFHLALENLLGNAHKFTSKRAQARIEVRAVSPAEQAVSAPASLTPLQQTPQQSCVLQIRDNGAGFDMRHAREPEQVFGVFRRLHSQSEFPGTGVGLAIVSRVMSKHGGRVWCDAQVDHGATFFLEFPEHPTAGE